MPRAPVIDELAHLSSEMLADIFIGVHDLKAQDIREAIQTLIWTRHATLGGAWSVREEDIGDPLSPPYQRFLGRHQIIAYCGESLPWTQWVRGGPRRPAHEHQVARMLDWGVFRGIECTCGRRSDRSYTDPLRLHIKWRQVTPSAAVWPVVTIPGVAIPHVQVCQFSQGVEDPDHAPSENGLKCLCGAPLGGDTDRRLPQY